VVPPPLLCEALEAGAAGLAAGLAGAGAGFLLVWAEAETQTDSAIAEAMCERRRSEGRDMVVSWWAKRAATNRSFYSDNR